MDKEVSYQREDVNVMISSPGEMGGPACRVCQCTESDKMGDAVLGFLGILSPSMDGHCCNQAMKLEDENASQDREKDSYSRNVKKKSEVVEFVSPKGEVFICNADVEMGYAESEDKLLELGCSCKNDLALVHYACALKWFVNHGSTVCEICGCVASNISTSDIKKVKNALKEYEALRQKTVNGVPIHAQVQRNSGVDPDAVAAIRRLRLSEISLWFNPNNNLSSSLVHGVNEQSSTSSPGAEELVSNENTAAKWVVEGTGILLATGLLTVTLAWLIAPHVGKRTAKNGLHILLGGVCALAVVIFFRFVSYIMYFGLFYSVTCISSPCLISVVWKAT
ncbi:OLC1v1008385C1 [Oldenlandia corymbosa var. corymbosa]|uniref:OLC1v1008385C1 n=1 Tax=Oldenlandia corymbosa var. corymbosa TaxID=529605 RepID=A0AAV1DM03_OLDCO|nr:OLC1v1008385C1 [Oldenlandia corymbosa var. corymbosa]